MTSHILKASYDPLGQTKSIRWIELSSALITLIHINLDGGSTYYIPNGFKVNPTSKTIISSTSFLFCPHKLKGWNPKLVNKVCIKHSHTWLLPSGALKWLNLCGIPKGKMYKMTIMVWSTKLPTFEVKGWTPSTMDR